MAGNKTFFKKATDGKFTLGDIFSDVKRKHTPQETARVFIAGTELTTPPESEMLATWQKPFLFARFLGVGLLFLALCYAFTFIHVPSTQLLMLGICTIVPLTLMLLVWEMNVPQNISLSEVLKIIFIGGILSLILTILLDGFVNVEDAALSVMIVAPIVEEIAKLAIVYAIIARRNCKYILNGILIGMAVGTGFAVFENFQYTFFHPMETIMYASEGLFAVGADAGDLLSILLSNGVNAAVVRALTDISGHGVYASLYGGGLVAAKGKEKLAPSCMKKAVFLKYFAFSILIHMLNNSGVISALCKMLFPGAEQGLMSMVLFGGIMGAIGIVIFLPLLRQGVNQAVRYVTALHDGSLTNAVQNPGAAPAPAPAVGDTNDCAAAPAVGAAAVKTGNKGGLIKFISGPDTGRIYSFPEGREVIIGRAGQCEVALPNNSNVSSIHCSVRVTGDALIVTDKGSTNGTVVGTRRLQPNVPAAIPGDAVVYLGSKNCAFRFIRV